MAAVLWLFCKQHIVILQSVSAQHIPCMVLEQALQLVVVLWVLVQGVEAGQQQQQHPGIQQTTRAGQSGIAAQAVLVRRSRGWRGHAAAGQVLWPAGHTAL